MLKSREEDSRDCAIEAMMARIQRSVRGDAEIEARRAEEREAPKRSIDSCLMVAGFPKRCVTLREFQDERWLRAERLLTQAVANGGGTWLVIGGRGGGKTTLATAVARGVMARGGRVRFAYLPEVLDAMRDSATTGLKRYGALDLLVIDEVTGESKLTGWQRDSLTALVRRRHDNELPTIMTANATKAVALQRLGATIASRMSQGGVIVADWPSFRNAGGTR